MRYEYPIWYVFPGVVATVCFKVAVRTVTFEVEIRVMTPA